jgi:hypothetical protein
VQVGVVGVLSDTASVKVVGFEKVAFPIGLK